MGPNLFSHLSHKTISIFFTGEGFMALSGLMIGYILYHPYLKKGLGGALGNSLKRSWKILRYYIAVYVLCSLPLLFLDLQSNTTLVDRPLSPCPLGCGSRCNMSCRKKSP